MSQGEIRARCPFGGDDPLRKKVPDALSRWWRVGGEEVVEGPVFANDDNQMFNRRLCLAGMDRGGKPRESQQAGGGARRGAAKD